MLNLMNVKVPSNSEILGFSCEVITSGALADAPKQTTGRCATTPRNSIRQFSHYT